MEASNLLKICIIVVCCSLSEEYIVITAWESNSIDAEQQNSVPPPVDQVAHMARYITHTSDWCTIASIGSHGNTTGYPRSRVYSFADGVDYWSTGIPYIYTTLMDPIIQDLEKDNRCSVTVSLAESDYCKKQGYDPEDPRCVQIILSGLFSFLQNGTQEYSAAKNALFLRHPVMQTWPKDHNWQVGKLIIEEVQVIDYFGGSKYPSVSDYFQASPF